MLASRALHETTANLNLNSRKGMALGLRVLELGEEQFRVVGWPRLQGFGALGFPCFGGLE